MRPLLRFLLSTGCRRGEALALEWRDVDLERGRAEIRRSRTRGVTSTPKSGRSRTILLPPSLCTALFDLVAERRRACVRRGWPKMPALVLCSEAGGPLDERNVSRDWLRVRRLAQKHGVRPLKLPRPGTRSRPTRSRRGDRSGGSPSSSAARTRR